MSSSTASKVAAHFLQFRIQYSSIALLCYDYTLTFQSEVKYMWGRKFRFSTLLYVFCRYALVANVLYVFAVTGKFPSRTRLINGLLLRIISNSCDSIYQFIGALSVFGRLAVVAALTARTYAVFGCNRIILLLLGPMALACMALDITHVPGLRCSGSSDNFSGGDRYFFCAGLKSVFLISFCLVSLALAILMRVFEFIAAVLTMVRSLLDFRIGRSWKIEPGSLIIVCFRQGMIYIIFTTVLSIIAAILQYRAPTGSIFQRLFNALSLPFSCLLTARFLLQLREWQERGSFQSTNCNDGIAMDGAQTQHAQTLSAFRAVVVFDAAVIDDFGDGESMTMSHSTGGWESDGLCTYRGDGVIEMEER
ncbi:uncharacterized protein FOMMEDRAFT_154517 [Fomitiporia mediterranea MF3/22]|uniref:uncharacterized protein n=1 Tax=Fomitiporia mediterranea (strain MF3/22) TaxID=694068 RepID=UPI0004407536|nr:uncharacterized protein FOMMEDRAFT_154517 [Fomitiporia mediterranea MF3/22]EJD05286.1 hypothetical protein FOMMEDRAFT_154517 [Fomitiporia mediterranea MF3/22]